MTTKYEYDERRTPEPQEGWHLKKEVNLSLIISVIGIAIDRCPVYSGDEPVKI
jgi:hypothetical protein